MRAFAWLRARPRAVASAAVLSAGAVAITTLAFVYEGFPTTEVDLHDGGVWVTKQSSLLVGHFNHESQVLDGGLRTSSDEYDILQSGDDVVMVDPQAASVTAIDPAMVSLTDSANVPAGAKVVLGGATLAILDPAKGSLWVVPAAGLGGVRRRGHRADRRDRRRRRRDGRRRRHGLRRLDRDLRGRHDSRRRRGRARRAVALGSARAIDEGAEVSITAVGDIAVVLDAASGTRAEHPRSAHRGGRRPARPSCSSRRPRRMPSSWRRTDALVRVPFDGSEPVEVSATVARAFRLHRCSSRAAPTARGRDRRCSCATASATTTTSRRR